jgi:hypothetical protein
MALLMSGHGWDRSRRCAELEEELEAQIAIAQLRQQVAFLGPGRCCPAAAGSVEPLRPMALVAWAGREP